jgi:TolB-like protein/Flp pilus assembly protein TadD/predicted Ser/Thr protein kinase
MTSAQFQAIEEVFHQALDCEPDQLRAYLDQSCAGDEDLRGKVEALLTSHRQAESFIESSIGAAAADIVGKTQLPRIGRVTRSPRMPEDLGDYELLEEIGRGGQGVVYRAHQKSLNRTVALKVIGLGTWVTEAHLKRFRREAEAAASLDHPLIVPIHEVGEREGCCYFSMNFIEGGQLDEVTKRQPMPIRRAVELIAKLARTVHYAHEHGILHRDIKPGNILLDARSKPHLTDFGLARLVESESTVTRTVEVLGTPSYMAPEQAAGNNAQLTRATDVYGLGAVLYQLLTSHPPFAGGTTYETIKLLLETEPRAPRSWNPKVDRDLSIICLKCLEKDPQRRYVSAFALAQDLERWLKHEPIRARRTGLFARAKKWLQRNPTIAAVAALSLALVAAVSVILWKSELFHHASTTGIAVLPFENLSNDREDAAFADGVQDDLLTKLAKIAALKVISRTSVIGYRGKQNTHEIGNALGVSHLLEGSVRKTGGWLHINAQLIDARTDSHVWAEVYDRDLKDMFAVQSEIAQKVAEQLHIKISPLEKLAIERPPTVDLTAYTQYSRAKTLILTTSLSASADKTLVQATELFKGAVARDPSFYAAFCQLVYAYDLLYGIYGDHTPARLAAAEAALQRAIELRPDAAETHLTRGSHLYYAYRDYKGALNELEAARAGLPNDPRVVEYTGYILRRQGRGEEGLRALEQAVVLDPRNPTTLLQLAISYQYLRHYAEEKAILQRVLGITPDDIGVAANLAFIDFLWRADTAPFHQFIDRLRAERPASVVDAADTWFECALAERDWRAAEQALTALGSNPFGDDAVMFRRQFGEGLLARAMHDEARARKAFTAARVEQEQAVQKQKDYGPPLCVLGLIDAALGNKEAALQEGRRAMELTPVEKDSTVGLELLAYFSLIAAWTGEKDLALQQLATAAATSGITYIASYGALKLLPFWDPLRGDPRFEQIVASLAPKEGNK